MRRPCRDFGRPGGVFLGQPQARFVRPLLLAATLCLAPEPGLGQTLPDAAACSLFTSVDVLTMEEDRLLTDHDVLVCGTRIRGLGPRGSLESPEGARRIEGEGRVLMPGLTDGHVHLFAPNDLQLHLVWGSTTVRNLFGNRLSVTLRDRIEGGVQWGPRMITAGPIVDGDPPVWDRSAVVGTTDAARETVATQIEAGYDFIKVYSRLEPEPFFATIQAAKAAGVRVGGHVPRSVSLYEAVSGGMEFIEHLTGFIPALQGEDSEWLRLSSAERVALDHAEVIRLQVEGFDPARLEVVAGWMQEHGVWNIPTFVVIERLAASAEHKEGWLAHHSQMRWVPQRTRDSWDPSNDFRLQNLTPEQLAIRRRSAALHKPIVKALHDAGCELMLGTDTPNPFVFRGYSVHEELQRFVSAGLTPFEALRTATVNAARFLDLESSIGRIAPDLEADLLLLEASPLESIENTQRIVGVMTRGRWLDREELDRLLEELAKTYGNE